MIKEVSIEIIKKCPNLCLYCSSSSDIAAKEIITFADLSDLIDRLIKLDVSRFCLSGGEPFLHPELLRIVKYISSFGIETDIYTCGITLIDNESRSISAETFHEFRKSGLNRVMFNLQSTNEDNYNKLTNTNGHYKIALQSIRNAIIANVPSDVHFVPMKINKNDIDEIISFSEREGIEQVSFLKLVPHGRAKANMETVLLSGEDDAEVQQKLLSAKSGGAKIRIGVPYSKNDTSLRCHAVNEKLYIRYDGFVFGCEAFKYIEFQDENTHILPNNISEKPINEIVKSSNHLKKSIELIGEYSSVQMGCENCPVQKYLRKMEEIK
jgi:MoaA/NifB/PqqE/SkfB family radical SAM enzyme